MSKTPSNTKHKAAQIIKSVDMDADNSIDSQKYGKASVPKEPLKHTHHISPMMQAVFENFFNVIKNNEVISSMMEITNLEFYTIGKLRHCEALKISDMNEHNRVAMFKFKDKSFSFAFTWEKSWDQSIHYYANISTKEPISLRGPEAFKLFFQMALDVSDLKGKCIDLKKGVHWDKFELKKTTFDDVYVPDSQMHDCKMFLDVYDKSDSMLRYLMVGPPGTCKTEMVTAIANEAQRKGVTIVKIAIDEHMADCVQFASYLSPALILLDDIDLMLGSRTAGGYSKNLGIFLDVMDGAKKISKDVGFLATTNSNQLLDMAAQRPGRFHRILNFSRINRDNVKNIIKKSLRLECNITDQKTINAFVDDKVASLLHGENKTGAYIYNVVHMLVLRAQSFNVAPTAEWLEKEIKSDIAAMDELKRSYVMKDHMENEGVSRGIGFSSDTEETEEAV